MTASFAAIEARAAASVMARLANATATIAASSVPVIFDRDSLALLGLSGGIDATQPAVLLLSSFVATLAITRNTVLVIVGTALSDGTYYVQRVQPDGTGLTLLVLSLEPA